MAVTWKKLAYEDDVITKAALTAKGDLITSSAAATLSILAIGSAGHVLTVADGAPSWAAPGTPGAHATTHKTGGSDSLKLNEFAVPTAAVAFNGQQATNLIVHTVADTAAMEALTPVVGKLVFKTDALAPYICTVDA